MSASTTIIGIDCATDPKKMGLAKGELVGTKLTLHKVLLASEASPSHLDLLSQWFEGQPSLLLALDAPLGWPIGMASLLPHHKAGELLDMEADALFRRNTDHTVCEETGKRSLDVGADRIARTARSALGLLHQLRIHTGQGLPLAWSQGPLQEASAIEVYPAVCLCALELSDKGYKKAGDSNACQCRETIVNALVDHMEFVSDTRDAMIKNADLLDAALCVEAGRQFLMNECLDPPDDDHIRREGWIWFKPPSS